MKHILCKTNPNNKYKIAVLIKEESFQLKEITKHYFEPLIEAGIKAKDIIAFDLPYGDRKKPTAAIAKNYIKTLLKSLSQLETTHLLICDSDYFKFFTGVKKTTGCIGNIYPIKDVNMSAVLTYQFTSLFHNPTNKENMDLAIETLVNSVHGINVELGKDAVKETYYPDTTKEIEEWLIKLKTYGMLSCDIEARSLKFYDAGIETIAFSWANDCGVSFSVDRHNKSQLIKQLLKDFLFNFTGTLIYHNATYDVTVLIYELWMKSINDHKGMLKGLEILTNNIHDTKILAYLALNNTSNNDLGLKTLAHSKYGDYGLDVKNTALIDTPDLLEYNIWDTAATYWVFEKYYPLVKSENQLSIYNKIFLPSIKTIIHMQLTGLPMDIDQINKTEKTLTDILNGHLRSLENNRYIHNFKYWMQFRERMLANTKLKKKVKPYSDFTLTFNPNSNSQLSKLLYNFLGLEILEVTDTKQPSTSGKTLNKLKNRITDELAIQLLNDLIEIIKVSKILSTFIPAFNNGVRKTDGRRYLFGNFNLGAVKSMRLSSSKVNLQQIPSTGSKYAKPIKECFKSPDDWLFMSSDFNGLESMIAALTTKDPNRLKVYEQGYDSHCWNAYGYWPDKMPDIDESVKSINSIKAKYPELRQSSKGITFSSQYGGTYLTYMDAGFTEKEAKVIETNYHKMYKATDDWMENHIKNACNIGYVPLAFGGKLRTPLLKQVVYYEGMPQKAHKEKRTAANALHQSYGQLTNRAANEFLERVYASKYKYDIKMCAQIHDAIYLLVKNSIGTVKWVNDNLVDVMKWQELPEIQHPNVKLGSEADVFKTWDQPVTLSNNASKKEILDTVKKGIDAYTKSKMET